MRNYEALYVLRPDLGEEETEALVNRFQEVVVENGGELVKLDKWGKRRLAYEVKKFREGFYVLMQFRGAAAVAQELERILKITDGVIRQLVVRLEDDAFQEEVQPETAEAE
ncbi:MAG: 30S ribosomal protein S6 [Clostridia bacterium]|jgi:small subunit ribosomal protein S6|nr:30S ribosomal protein S6 [Clostridia bacterium]